MPPIGAGTPRTMRATYPLGEDVYLGLEVLDGGEVVFWGDGGGRGKHGWRRLDRLLPEGDGEKRGLALRVRAVRMRRNGVGQNARCNEDGRSPRGQKSSARSRSRTRDIGSCTVVPRTARRAREKHGAGNGSVPLLLLLCPPLLRPAQLLLALLEGPEVDEQALCRRVGDLPVFVRAGEHVVGVRGEVAVAS